MSARDRLDTDRARDRRHQGRPAGRRHRRRGPRERGRPDLRRRAGHPRAGRLHGPVHLGLHLRADHRGRRRPARPAADVPDQPGPPRHRVHRHRRRPRGRHAPASRPPTGRTRSGCSPTRRPPPADLARPGHVVPLRAKDGGVLRRPGHTEAAVDLAVLAGLRPAGVLCEIVSEKDPTGMARGDELRVFADEHDLALISIADLIAYRRRFEKLVERVAEARRAAALRRVHRGRLPQLATTSASTSPSSSATSATARTCWSGCTPSA